MQRAADPYNLSTILKDLMDDLQTLQNYYSYNHKDTRFSNFTSNTESDQRV